MPPDSKGWTIEIESDNYPTQYLDGDYDEGTFFSSLQEDLGSFSILSGIDVQGYVQDEEGLGISESNVHVYSGGEVKTTQSENDGWFSIEGLPLEKFYHGQIVQIMQPHISLTPLPRSVTSMPRRRMPCGQCKSCSSIRINPNNSCYRYVWRPHSHGVPYFL